MTNRKNLRAYFPNYLSSDAVFSKMVVLGAPWPQEVAQDMDDAYFTMWSGIKTASEFVTLHLNPNSEVANALTIARILYGIYGDNWTRLWEANKTKYTPLDNYNIQETVARTQTDDRIINKIGDLTSTVDGTEKQTTENDATQNQTGSNSSDTVSDSNGTSSVQHGLTIHHEGETDDYIYAFNSEEKVPTAVQITTSDETHGGTDTTTTSDNATSTITGTTKNDVTDHSTGTQDTTTTSARADKTTEDTTDNLDTKEDITRNRQGNVGQNTYQELLKQEFELWRWNFYKQVFEDVDTFLCLSVYSGCLEV